MSIDATRPTDIACSFCGRPQAEAARLIVSPGWATICDRCIREAAAELQPPALPLYGPPRPMADAPHNGKDILLLLGKACIVAAWNGDREFPWIAGDNGYHRDAFRGWWPLPPGDGR